MIFTVNKRDGSFENQYQKFIGFFIDDSDPNDVKMSEAYANIVKALPKNYRFKNMIQDFRQVVHLVMQCKELQTGIYMINYNEFEKTYDALSNNPTSPQFAKFALSVYNGMAECVNKNNELVRKFNMQK